MQVIFVGMMFSGKTSVGKQLALLCNRKWVDSDYIIMQKYGNIQDIFQKYGEKYFRDIEEETIDTILKENSDCILSTGGGAIEREKTLNRIKDKTVIYLKTSLPVLLERASHIKSGENDNRPLLDKIEQLYARRQYIYEKIAKYTITTDKKNIDAVTQEIIKLL